MSGSSFNAEEFLARLTEITKANLTNSQFGVSELAREMGMSRSNLHLRVKKLTKTSVSQFINQIRLKRAMEILKHESLTISETAFDCGFQSVSYFTKCFHSYYGFPPSETGKYAAVEKIEEKDQLNKTLDYKKWSTVIILVLAILIPVTLASYNYFIKKIFPSQLVELEYSIAVLPFTYESTDTTNVYFINGLMETILNNLSNTPDLIVRSRTSVEKYRNTNKSLPELARELNVNYIVAGSGQKYGDMVVLNVKLLEAFSDRHLFSKQYKQEIKDVKDFAGLHSEIALDLASEIKATIKPEDVLWYKEISTENFKALSYYLQGLELIKLSVGHKDWFDLQLQAKAKFEKSLELDSTFVLPMLELGWLSSGLHRTSPPEKNYLDSAFYYANKAKKYDNKSAGAYHLLGRLFLNTGEFDKAMESYQLALQDSENLKLEGIYRAIGLLNFQKGNYLQGIEFLYKQLQIEIEDGHNLNYWTLHSIYQNLRLMGFIEKSQKYSSLILKQTNDSAAWYDRLMAIHFTAGDFDSVLNAWTKRLKTDSTNLTWSVPRTFTFLKNYQPAFRWVEKYRKELKPQPYFFESFANSGLAFIYLQNGQPAKADSLFDESIKYLNNESGYFPETNITSINLASIYSAMEETDMAFRYLSENKSTNMLALTTLKHNPMFDNIRNDLEFQKIVNAVETSYHNHFKQIENFLHKVGEIE